MTLKWTLLAVIIHTFVVIASSAANFAVVPLCKGLSLTTTDNVFNLEKAALQATILEDKHRQNIDNYHQRAKGRMKVRDTALPPRYMYKERQSEPLIDENSDSEWTGFVSIGTPGQKFLVDVDTGSSDLWVTSASCNSSICASKRKYEASLSPTSMQIQGEGAFEIVYGDKSTVSGPIYRDTVNIGGIEVQNQYFSPVTNLSRQFDGDPIDGIIGLAFPSISNIGRDTFIDNAYQQGAIPARVFGLYLANTGSELYLGGYDQKHFTGDIEYHSLQVNDNPGFWEIGGASVYVGDTLAQGTFPTIIDSGTTLVYGPPDMVKSVYALIPGAAVFDEKQGFYSFPCRSTPKVSFSWGGRKWSIPGDSFNLGLTRAGASTCVGALVGNSLGLRRSTWLLGGRFLKHVYTVFDADELAIGFAQLRSAYSGV
ncbi:acid protease [Dendrothele bispora CBS 962.96]|uniref:Acid protease n=1 Tax=Dendrothele bispora (strain CBS 962.96) TaxID=1314807 RepID=A0A4S8MWY9_DENBC|nr:acid protease [Dendrothele bispora CBS 962.96]